MSEPLIPVLSRIQTQTPPTLHGVTAEGASGECKLLRWLQKTICGNEAVSHGPRGVVGVAR